MCGKMQMEARINRLCRMGRFSPYIVWRKSKNILEQYRNTETTKRFSIEDEQAFIEKLVTDIREKYIKSYLQKCNEKTGSLQEAIPEIFCTKWADEIIDEVLLAMESFAEGTDVYNNIIMEYYLGDKRRDDVDIQVEMDLQRTKYYELKKQAIILFGILLWNTVIDKCIIE